MIRKVAVIMGSDSDWPVVKGACAQLKALDIPFEAHILSAHRTPAEAAEFAKNARANGFGVILCAAGMAAHLAGAFAANTTLPVIGIPMKGGAMDGLDALLATVQMPSGIPVATVALNGAKNAAWLAAEILALGDEALAAKLDAERVAMARQIAAAFTAAGAAAETVELPWEEYTAALTAGRFDLYYGEVRLTADWDVSSLLATGGSLNYGGWSDPQCDQLLEGCRSGGNREAAFRGLCRYLQSQAPILPICFKTVSTLYESDVLEGLTPTAAEPFYGLENISIHLRAN